MKSSRLLDTTSLKEFRKELAIMRTLRHPNIIEFLGVCEDDNGELCLVTEFLRNGSLEDVFNDLARTGDQLPLPKVW